MSGCSLKNVMKDEADDIEQAHVYIYGGSQYLILLENIFQATSKEYDRGIYITRGYNVSRISVYDLTDGKLVMRKKTGRQQENPVEMLGCTEGNIWLYSFGNGIHSMDPVTLTINVSQDDIFEINPGLRDHLAACEWYQLQNYYQFDEVARQIVLTDDMGYRYFLNPESLTITRMNREFYRFDPRRDQPFVSSIHSPQPYLSLTGDLRKQIRIEGMESDSTPTFLEGHFIADRDPARTVNGIDERLSCLMNSLDYLNNKIIKLKELNGGSGPRFGDPLRDTLRLLDNARRRLESDTKKLEQYRSEIAERGSSAGFIQLLSPDTTSFFVFHKSGTDRDAGSIISRVQKDNRSLKVLWETEIGGLFFNPSDARETNSFKRVFSKGEPEFGFSFFDMTGNKLLVIRMLHVYCLDIETGTILWKFRV